MLKSHLLKLAYMTGRCHYVMLYPRSVLSSLHSKNYARILLLLTHTHPYTKNGNFYETVFLFLVKSCLGMYCDQIWMSKYFFTGFNTLKKTISEPCFSHFKVFEILSLHWKFYVGKSPRVVCSSGRLGREFLHYKDITFNWQTVEFNYGNTYTSHFASVKTHF